MKNIPFSKWALMGVSLAISLLAAELGVRGIHAFRGTYGWPEHAEQIVEEGPWMASPDPELAYVHKPSYQAELWGTTNSAGIIRQEDTPPQAPEGTYRIALLGDSIGAGYLVADEENFGVLLEHSLSIERPMKAARVEVLNFSVSGYASRQEARLLESHAVDFDPDLILLQYCMNDPGVAYVPYHCFVDLEPPTSHLYDLFARKLGLVQDPRKLWVPTQKPGEENAHDQWIELYDPESATWRSVVQSFERVDAVARRSEIPVLLVVFPLFVDPSGSAVCAPFHRQVQELGSRLEWDVLDLSEAYAAYPLEELRARNDDIYHPNALGHSIAAERIHARIVEMTSAPAPLESSSAR